jgi:hypothetical protein
MSTVGQLKTLQGSVEGSRPIAINVQPGTHTVYCDEAGFTGNNLLDHQQPFFAYSAVALEAAEVAEIVEHIVRDRGVQGGELKAPNLVKSPRGQQTMLRVLDAIQGRYAVTFHEKKYALACKLFEDIFEPALQRNSKFFYDPRQSHQTPARCHSATPPQARRTQPKTDRSPLRCHPSSHARCLP